MPQELLPFVFSSPKSIKFELSALLPFRKYIVFSTLPGIKMHTCTLDTLKFCKQTSLCRQQINSHTKRRGHEIDIQTALLFLGRWF